MHGFLNTLFELFFSSAGVGRTGTFIAFDALAQNGAKTGTVNVKRYVNRMRRERMYMIQTMVFFPVFFFVCFRSTVFIHIDTSILSVKNCKF